MMAVLETGGKQYEVSPGAVIKVEKLPAQVGEEVALDKILMIEDEGKCSWGTPYLEGVSVLAEVTAQDKAKKIIVYKFKRRKSYHRTRGHRQRYTELEIKEIKKG